MTRKAQRLALPSQSPTMFLGLARFIRSFAQHFPSPPVAPLNTPLPDDGL
jgi:hypothetical protein